jgi:hypothetical protein
MMMTMMMMMMNTTSDATYPPMCAVAEGLDPLVAVQIGRLTVVARNVCGSMHSTGKTRDERGTISGDGTASGGPVQQEKLRRTHVSMQAGRNPTCRDSQGRLREE